MDPGYPKVISENWKGVPDFIDAAFSSQLDQKTYFIKGNKIYMFDDEWVEFLRFFFVFFFVVFYNVGKIRCQPYKTISDSVK